MFYRPVGRILITSLALAISFVIPALAYAPYRPLVTSPTILSYGTAEHGSQTITDILQAHINRTAAKRGCVLLIDANNGQIIVATSITRETNAFAAKDMIIESAWEPGSVMKSLLLASALNENRIDAASKIYQNNLTYIDGFLVTNSHEYTHPSFSVEDMISQSINTAAVKTLQSMSDYDQVDEDSRENWHFYLTEKYRFGTPTGIDRPHESHGFVPSATSGTELNIRYANTAIGQGLTMTPLQLVSAYAAVINGGTYYRPFANSFTESSHVLSSNIVSEDTSKTMKDLLRKAFIFDFPGINHENVSLGAKSGTAHSADEGGNYIAGNENGTYIGFIDQNGKTFILLVRLDGPQTQSIASVEAGKAWVDIVEAVTSKL